MFPYQKMFYDISIITFKHQWIMTARLGSCQISPERRQSITEWDHHIICFKFPLFYCCDILLFAFCFLEINAYMLNILQHISKMPIAIKVIWFYFSLTWIKNRKGNIGKNITWHKFVHKNNHAEDTEYVQII